ncbi:hypothetical protein HDU83_007766 [Entophlyctis luteolus]|nr:hypothetical protein HDU82_008505 [Entophlyctis luteolus]KAJ3352696.1 hypothetical protein HDU83_007766 [Entophlyctis luteolus]KAJ3387718.1 hypothetical protein HDU84_000597 [Entophlyctis sp. JEL0112]
MSDRGGSADPENAAGTTPASASTSKGSQRDSAGKGGSKRGSVTAYATTAAAGANTSGAPAADSTPNTIVYENTFKMRPDRKFQSEPVQKIAEEILQINLKKAKYDPAKIPDLTAKIGNELLAAVKKLDFDRYKIVVDVSIGEFKGQGIRVASRSLWDTTTDSYASASFRNVRPIESFDA